MPAPICACDVQAPGVAGFFGAGDVPGDNCVGAVVHDEDLFADGAVTCVGQPIGLIVADSEAQARAAARWPLHTHRTPRTPLPLPLSCISPGVWWLTVSRLGQ